MTHPDAPVGTDCRATTRSSQSWGEPRKFDFKPKDHVALCREARPRRLRGRGGASPGTKFYFLKNEAVLLELALVQYAMQNAAAGTATRRSSRRTWRASKCSKASASCRAANPETQIYTHRRHRPVPGRDGRDHARRHAPRPDPRRGRAAAQVRRPVALLPHRGRRAGPRHARPLSRASVHKVEMFAFCDARAERGDPPGDRGRSRRRSSRAWGCRTT